MARSVPIQFYKISNYAACITYITYAFVRLSMCLHIKRLFMFICSLWWFFCESSSSNRLFISLICVVLSIEIKCSCVAVQGFL